MTELFGQAIESMTPPRIPTQVTEVATQDMTRQSSLYPSQVQGKRIGGLERPS